MSENSTYITFMLNYMIKVYPFFHRHRLKVAYVFRGEYTKIYLQCYRIIKIIKCIYL
jgi:hypothetical protein